MEFGGKKENSKTKTAEQYNRNETQTTSGVQTSTQSLNPWSLEQYNAGRTGILGTLDNYNQNSPYKAYSGPLTAGLTDAERQARAIVSARAGRPAQSQSSSAGYTPGGAAASAQPQMSDRAAFNSRFAAMEDGSRSQSRGGGASFDQGALPGGNDGGGQNGLLDTATNMISRASNAGPNLTEAARVDGLMGYNPQQYGGTSVNNAITANAPTYDPLATVRAQQLGQASQVNAPNMGALSSVNAPNLGQVRQVTAPNLGKANTFEAAMAGSAQIGAMDQIGNRLGEIDKYQNPELSRVVDTTLASYDEDAARQRARMQAQGAAAGKFGGSRFGVEQGIFGADVARNRAGVEAGLRSSAYDRATGLLGSDVGTVNQGKIAQAGMDQQAAMANAAAENAARAANTGAKNQFLMQQGLLGFEADQYNTGAANARDSERAGFDFNAASQNMAAQNQRASERAGYDFNASRDNAGAQNQFALQQAQFGQTADMANMDAQNQRSRELAASRTQNEQFNVANQNQRESERAQMAQQAGLFNTGAANDAQRFGADVNNQGALTNAGYQQQANLTNAQAREQALGRQMQGAGLLANVQGQQFGQDMQVADSLRQMGMDERQIADLQILREMAQYDKAAADQLQRVQMQLQAQFGLLGAAPMLTDSRQTTDGTMSGTQSGTSSSTGKTSGTSFEFNAKIPMGT